MQTVFARVMHRWLIPLIKSLVMRALIFLSLLAWTAIEQTGDLYHSASLFRFTFMMCPGVSGTVKTKFESRICLYCIGTLRARRHHLIIYINIIYMNNPFPLFIRASDCTCMIQKNVFVYYQNHHINSGLKRQGYVYLVRCKRSVAIIN